MAHVAREGSVFSAAECILSALGCEDPTPEQRAGSVLVAYALADLKVIASGKVWKE